MSLPPQRLDWRIAPGAPQGLRIGLSLEIGCGATPDAERARGDRARRARFRARGRHRRADRPDLHASHARRARPVLAHALDDRHRRAGAGAAREGAAVHPRLGGIGARRFRARRCSRLQPDPGMRDAAVAATAPFDFVLSPTAPITAFPAELASPSDDPLNPFPHIGFTVAFNMSGQPARRSTAASTRAGCRSACRSSAAASTISACWRSRGPTKRSARPRCAPGRRRLERLALRPESC